MVHVRYAGVNHGFVRKLALFDAARARGNEGLMVKDPDSRYAPGRRGREWLKVKRALATLDVVVTAAEVAMTAGLQVWALTGPGFACNLTYADVDYLGPPTPAPSRASREPLESIVLERADHCGPRAERARRPRRS